MNTSPRPRAYILCAFDYKQRSEDAWLTLIGQITQHATILDTAPTSTLNTRGETILGMRITFTNARDTFIHNLACLYGYCAHIELAPTGVPTHA